MKWKDGGTWSDRWRSERFDDENSAKVLKDAVDEAGQRWPPGRVNIDPTAADELRYRFEALNDRGRNWRRPDAWSVRTRRPPAVRLGVFVAPGQPAIFLLSFTCCFISFVCFFACFFVALV